MRERERRANERRQAQADCFEVIKDELGYYVLMYPTFRRNLETALLFPRRGEDQQKALFENMVQTSAAFCLNGDPEYRASAEYWCHYLIEMVDLLAHVRPALERAVALYREAGKPVPHSLRAWAENPRDPPPRRRGPRAFAQDWTASRDQIIALAVDGGVHGKNLPWPWKLAIGRACSSEEWRHGYSVCRAVVEVLEERYGGHPGCQLPTYNMVWNAWRRYRNELRRNGRPRPGRPLLPPQGLAAVVNPLGIDTVEMRQAFLEKSKAHLRRCARRDPGDSQ